MNNQKNTFSENNFNSDSNLDFLFKEALQNHGVPTEDHVWRRIQNGLADKKTVTQPITKHSSLPIWSAVTGIAASLLIWAVFFGNSNQNELNNVDTNSVATTSKTEIVKKLNKTENNVISNTNSILENTENNQSTEATSSKVIASNKQQIPPTITIKNTTAKKSIAINSIDKNKVVASLEKDQTKIKKSQDKINEKTFINPSTHISENVWASDFVVQNSNYSTKKETQNTTTHQLNLDNQTVAITIKVGKNDMYSTTDITTSQATGFDENQNPSQFDKAKTVLKEVWNLKSGKKVNLQNILPNNENEKATTNPSSSNNEIQAD